jgi:hypothetical protein
MGVFLTARVRAARVMDLRRRVETGTLLLHESTVTCLRFHNMVRANLAPLPSAGRHLANKHALIRRVCVCVCE